jgi:SAM-dependent methyltransferase
MEIKISEIDSGQGFDWGRTSEDYAKFRDIYPDVFYKKIIEMGLYTKGQRVLDLGTGTGVLPRNLYKYGASFTGADISENQIKEARRLSAQAGMDISYVVSPAETLDFPDAVFDAVTACQCYTYFDKAALFPKIHSLLKDRGHFCILFMAWLISDSTIAENSEKIVLKHNPAWTDHSVKRFTFTFPDEAVGLFEMADSFVYDVPVAFTRKSWHGRMKACRGIGASLPAEKIAEFEEEHISYLESVPESFDIPHFVTVLNLRKT